MLKWWRMPLYPVWINAENTIIWLVTFQIQISKLNFQIQNNFLLAGFCCKRHKDKEITKNLFTLTENNLGKRKFSYTRLNFGKILFVGMKQAVLGGQYRSILPAQVANQNTEFAAYCPLAELAI